eukprot:gnl/Chilomastix_cuspidata/2618.p1 GENE.gnl/Chilomastix_cuspidata/2618~~gnl/Chilomastix_cuspidata/2618.p1  ORF type:complete len:303 (-),score=125.23 gnl/Chilomastix_cuspidata/2618:1078-1986(-)
MGSPFDFFVNSIVILTSTSGAVYEGIMDPSSSLEKGGDVVLSMAQLLHSPRADENHCDETFSIEVARVKRMTITRPRARCVAPRQEAAAPGRPRRLQRFELSGAGDNVSLEDMPSAPSGDAAMSAFERQSGTSDFSLDRYTVPIDRAHEDFRNYEAKAAREIRGHLRSGRRRYVFAELPDEVKRDVAQGRLPARHVTAQRGEIQEWARANGALAPAPPSPSSPPAPPSQPAQPAPAAYAGQPVVYLPISPAPAPAPARMPTADELRARLQRKREEQERRARARAILDDIMNSQKRLETAEGK